MGASEGWEGARAGRERRGAARIVRTYVVAAKVYEHDMLGSLLLVRQELRREGLVLVNRRATRPRTCGQRGSGVRHEGIA